MQNNIPFNFGYPSKETPAEAVAAFLAEAARLIENQAGDIKQLNKESASSLEYVKAGREMAAILRGIVIEGKKVP